MKVHKALLMLFAFFAASQSYSQCSICSTPAAPSEYGGTINNTQYQGSVIQLWAATPSVAICERDWYKVVGIDTTSLGTGDTISTIADSTCKYIARNKNTCSGTNYYSPYTLMGTITVVDSPTVPTFTASCLPVICSGTPTDIFLSTTTGAGFLYLRGDTANVSGSMSGSSYNGALSVTLTNKTSSAQTVRFVIRMYATSPGVYYANSQVVYVTVLPSTAPAGNHCFVPGVPHQFISPYGAYAISYYKGAHTQLFADSTITADSVLWYKVVGLDTTYAGHGYSINITTDTTCKYIARNANVCNCSSASAYYSGYFPMENVTVLTGITPTNFRVANDMPTIASGTQIDLVPEIDSGAFNGFYLYRDNANVSGTNSYGYSELNVFGFTLTNTTSVPQLVRYLFISFNGSSINGNSVSGYVTVLPSTSTAPAGNHCTLPTLANNNYQYAFGTPQNINYVKGAVVNLDGNHVFTNAFVNTPISVDSVDWYKVRWPGDTTYLGNSYPVNATMDTNCRIFSISKNVCYWSDSSKHIYSSAKSNALNAKTYSGTNPTATFTNNSPSLCNGTPVNISVSSASGNIVTWYRDNTPPVTGKTSGNIYYTFPAAVLDTLTDTVSTPQQVNFGAVSGVTISGKTCYGSSALTSVTTYPTCARWANTIAVHPALDSVCAGTTVTMTSDTLPCSGGTRYLWSSGDTTRAISKSSAGTYTVTATNTCGCSATASSVIVIRANPSPTASHDTICSGSIATMTSTGGTHYIWSNGDSTAIFTTSAAGTYTVTATNSLGCSATAMGTVTLITPPSSPTAPTPQYACAISVYTFTFDSIQSGTGGNEIEWSSTTSSFDSSTIATAPATISITVPAGLTDTIWMRSKVNASGCVSSTVYTTAYSIRQPSPPAQPALQSAVSDTPVLFTFANISTGYGGNEIEWSLDSNFTMSYYVDTPTSLSIIDSSRNVSAIWIRSKDTVSGCVSTPVMAVAVIIGGPHGPPPIDTFIAVCVGGSTSIAVPGSLTGKRYAIRIDSTVINTLLGTGDTIHLSTGAIDSSETFNVIATDTISGTVSIVDTGVFIMVIPPITALSFISGDTLIFIGDTAWACYSAVTTGSTKTIYSIPDSSGTIIDSSSGCISNVTTNFTVRAVAYSLPGCGTATKDIHIAVTDVGLPILPALNALVIDSPGLYSYSIDSVLSGAGGDEIEWSFLPDFSVSTLVVSPATISFSINAPGDTVIYVRSKSSRSGKTSKAVKAAPSTVLPLYSAGLLDKTNWVYNALSDEFNYSGPLAINNMLSNWALNYCWHNSSVCSPDASPLDCGNHYIEPSGGGSVQALMNTGEYNDGTYISTGGNGSGNEVTFDAGIAHLMAIPITSPFSIDCHNYDGTHTTGTISYKTGMLASIHTFDMLKPSLFEIRAKKANSSVSDVGNAFWIDCGPLELDVIDNPFGANTANNFTNLGMINWAKTYTDGSGTHQVSCGADFTKLSACDFNEDWHTYTCLITGSHTEVDPSYNGPDPANNAPQVATDGEIIYFIDGKEIWSRSCVGLTTSYFGVAPFWSGAHVLLTTGPPESGTGDYQIDYFRYYTPSGYNILTNTPPTLDPAAYLQNIHSGIHIANTLENPNIPSVEQLANGQILYNPYPGSNYHSIGPISTGQSFGLVNSNNLFYKNINNQIYNVTNFGTGTAWTQTRLNATWNIAGINVPILVNDINDFITPANSNLVYFQNKTANRLAYLQNNSGTWSESYAKWDNHSFITNINGPFFVDQLNRVWFQDGFSGTSSYIYTWVPWGNITTKLTPIVPFQNIVIASCGCLIFYVDITGELRQMYWEQDGFHEFSLPIVGPPSVLFISAAPNSLAIDMENSRVYFIGQDDNSIYYYNWNYSLPNTAGNAIVKLGQNATEINNEGTTCSSYGNAMSDLVLSSDNNTLYYKATDGTLWYFFNDKADVSFKNPATGSPQFNGPNWNKTPLTNSTIQGPIALSAISSPWDELFYAGGDQTLYNPSWVKADNPVNCPANSGPHSANDYKKSDPEAIKKDTLLNSFDVSVSPNPSENLFKVTVNGINDATDVDVSILTIDGHVVYEVHGVSNNNKFGFTWDAETASSGLYFYRIKLSDGRSNSGKMVKI